MAAAGTFLLPPPSLVGLHQIDNAGIAVAAIRASGLPVSEEALVGGVASAEWPARLQCLRGQLARRMPAGWELWLDGGHNPGAGLVLAEQLRAWADRPVHLIVGMKQAKDSAEFLRPMIPLATTLWAVAEPSQHMALPVDSIIAASGGAAQAGPTVASALAAIPRTGPTAGRPGRVLICGSLYLAGEVLKADQD
jgi:dihydrofolate synthase/folylpolyglutamate synthase